MRLAIVGSRTFSNYKLLLNVMQRFFTFPKDIDLIISGGAQGADSLAQRFASYWAIQTLIIKPNWKMYGKSAGFLRNQTIVDNCDTVLAFWDGESRGTADTLAKAKRAKKTTITVYV